MNTFILLRSTSSLRYVKLQNLVFIRLKATLGKVIEYSFQITTKKGTKWENRLSTKFFVKITFIRENNYFNNIRTGDTNRN